ncbi:hypothetical protein ACHWQZ_G018689 [Mnemiopsis leidyi]
MASLHSTLIVFFYFAHLITGSTLSQRVDEAGSIRSSEGSTTKTQGGKSEVNIKSRGALCPEACSPGLKCAEYGHVALCY